tara:strand:+ start:321 stop:1067 length:747 start_codon:yes stop_codon:yes gene_type:complete
MEMKAMMPLIIFDAVVNFYLTMLFVLPLRSLYSYKNTPNSALRTIALRSFVGSLATLTSSVVNLTVLMILKGEEAWICLMCCNADILFSVLVLHWVTSKDSGGGASMASTASLGITSRRRQRRESEPIASPTAGTIDKLEVFGVFGDHVIGGGSVTTHISAEKGNAIVAIGEQNGQEMYDLENGNGANAKRASDKEDYPLRRIQVQVGHTIETTSKSGATNGLDESEDVGDFRLARSHLSTDELVRKQ